MQKVIIAVVLGLVTAVVIRGYEVVVVAGNEAVNEDYDVGGHRRPKK